MSLERPRIFLMRPRSSLDSLFHTPAVLSATCCSLYVIRFMISRITPKPFTRREKPTRRCRMTRLARLLSPAPGVSRRPARMGRASWSLSPRVRGLSRGDVRSGDCLVERRQRRGQTRHKQALERLPGSPIPVVKSLSAYSSWRCSAGCSGWREERNRPRGRRLWKTVSVAPRGPLLVEGRRRQSWIPRPRLGWIGTRRKVAMAVVVLQRHVGGIDEAS